MINTSFSDTHPWRQVSNLDKITEVSENGKTISTNHLTVHLKHISYYTMCNCLNRAVLLIGQSQSVKNELIAHLLIETFSTVDS